MFQYTAEILHTSTRGKKDHDLRWTLFIDEMNQLTQFLIRFTDLIERG